MRTKTALVTGATGQDGAYLCRFLLDQGYQVYGMARRMSCRSMSVDRLAHLSVSEDPHFKMVDGDVTDLSSLLRIVRDAQPDEVYNLAAQSFVGASWQQPLFTLQATGVGAVNMLEAVRLEAPNARYYQASSSEMFGTSGGATMQDENTPFAPCSPYAVVKAMAHHMTVNYRNSFGMHASCGILFNHESPLRGIEFVTRKITHGVAMIAAGKADRLVLGNLQAKRDWGHAYDYVHAMWLMLQQDKPDDYVVATGKAASVQEFVDLAFACVGLDVGKFLHQDPNLIRPNDVPCLCGDATKAARVLGWGPKIGLEQLVSEMVRHDTRLIQQRG